MTAFLAFLGSLAAIVVVAVVVNRVRGARAHHLDAWTPGPDERTLAEDGEADFAVVPRLGQARVMTFPRLRRTHAVMTSARIVVATRALASRRYMITHVVHLDGGSGEPPAELGGLGGGLTTVGYTAIAARPSEMTLEDDHGKPYLRIVPQPTRSATNVEHCRLYSDRAALFLDAARSI